MIRSVSAKIQQREVMYQTRDGVFHRISKRERKVVYQTRNAVFHAMSMSL